MVEVKEEKKEKKEGRHSRKEKSPPVKCLDCGLLNRGKMPSLISHFALR
jgi:hypothetical protein